MSIKHQYSHEQLVHFVCGRCRKPWTISTTENVTARAWTCPHCCYNAALEPMPPMQAPDESPIRVNDMKLDEILSELEQERLSMRKMDVKDRRRQFWQRYLVEAERLEPTGGKDDG